jgi:hypothetical protein
MERVQHEHEIWQIVYPINQYPLFHTRIDIYNGQITLVVPYFYPITFQQFIDKSIDVLIKQEIKRLSLLSIEHGDIRRINIGMYTLNDKLCIGFFDFGHSKLNVDPDQAYTNMMNKLHEAHEQEIQVQIQDEKWKLKLTSKTTM